MTGHLNRALKLAMMVLLVVASTIGFGVLTVVGFQRAPYLAVPLVIALLVWGLFRAYNALMRQAERAYLESKKAKERARAFEREAPTADEENQKQEDRPS